MSYYEQLQPWCIIRHLPNAQNALVARFRKRSEAEDYLRSLQRLLPKTAHSLIFDPGDPSTPAPNSESLKGLALFNVNPLTS